MGAIRLFLAYNVFLDHECIPAVRRGLSCDYAWALNLTGAKAVIFFYIVSGFLRAMCWGQSIRPQEQERTNFIKRVFRAFIRSGGRSWRFAP